MKAEALTPSIGRSLGTRFDAPTMPASVGSQSTAASICSVTTPAGTLPGQRTMAGTRILPSNGESKKVPRHGPFEPPEAMAPPSNPSPPLSLLRITMVVVDAGFLDRIQGLSHPIVHFGDTVGVQSSTQRRFTH